MAEVMGLAIASTRRGAMECLGEVKVTLDGGLEGDRRGQPGNRQVTVLTASGWQQACNSVGVALPWTVRRANILVDGLELQGQTGRRLDFGEVVLEITGETDPCQRMEAEQEGLFDALRPDWRGGVTCRVVRGGMLRRGLPVRLE